MCYLHAHCYCEGSVSFWLLLVHASGISGVCRWNAETLGEGNLHPPSLHILRKVMRCPEAEEYEQCSPKGCSPKPIGEDSISTTTDEPRTAGLTQKKLFVQPAGI